MLLFLKLSHRSLQASFFAAILTFLFLGHSILLTSNFHLTNSFQVFDPSFLILIPMVKYTCKTLTFQVYLPSFMSPNS